MTAFRSNLRGSLILAFASLLWGCAFAVQNILADLLPPFMVNALRSVIGVIFLLLVLLVRWRITGKPILPSTPQARRHALLAGLLCGVLLTVSVNLQQFGLMLYPKGVAVEARCGFLTSLYVLLVPLLSCLFGKRPSPTVWFALTPALGGIYLLCLSGDLSGFYLGDLLILLCALSFSLHILVIDRTAQQVDGLLLSVMQFAVCAILSFLLSAIFERPEPTNFAPALPWLLYMGVLCTGIGYTLQIIGQRFAEPTVASLTMSLESVFAALAGWVISGNTLSPSEIAGCSLVFLAIVLAQLPISFPRKCKKRPLP